MLILDRKLSIQQMVWDSSFLALIISSREDGVTLLNASAMSGVNIVDSGYTSVQSPEWACSPIEVCRPFPSSVLVMVLTMISRALGAEQWGSVPYYVFDMAPQVMDWVNIFLEVIFSIILPRYSRRLIGWYPFGVVGSLPFLLMRMHLTSFHWGGKYARFHNALKSMWKRYLFGEKQACMMLYGILSYPGAVVL